MEAFGNALGNPLRTPWGALGDAWGDLGDAWGDLGDAWGGLGDAWGGPPGGSPRGNLLGRLLWTAQQASYDAGSAKPLNLISLWMY